MKKSFGLFSIILLLNAGVFAQKAVQHLEHLTILHWNDFHAQNAPYQVKDLSNTSAPVSYSVGGTATLLSYIKQEKANRKNVAVFNAGDDFQGTPISSFTYGRSQIELMNLIAPDAVTLGNHEFDYGMNSLQTNISRAAYPVLCANVVSTTTNLPLGLPYLARAFGNIKVGLVGLTPPDLGLLTFVKNLEGYRIRDLDSTLDLTIGELKLKEHPDIIILISHMGVDADTQLAAKRNDIDIIVGGHTHTALFSPLKKNRAIVVQAGSRGQYLGELDVTVDLTGDSIVNYSGRLIETKTDRIIPDAAASKKVQEYEKTVDEKLGEVIGTLTTPWDRQGGKKTEINIGNYESDAFRWAAKTDVAFHNIGGIRKDLEAGPIKMRDIWEINPFGNTLVMFSVRGDTLRKMMEWQAAIRPRDFVQVSGMKYVYDSSRSVGHQLISLEIGGQPVNDSIIYSICTNNYAGSHLRDLFGIDEKNVHIVETGLIDRDAVIEYIKYQPTVSSRIEGRIVNIARPSTK